MKCKIVTKNGTEVVDTTAPLIKHGRPIHKALVNYFENWINSQPEETREQYFGSFEEMEGGSYCCAKGAVNGMHDALIEYIEEYSIKTLSTKDFRLIDFDGILQP